MTRGKLIIVVGPTGSGKGTLVQHALETFPNLVFPVSATTRAPRPTEVDGVNYHFLTETEFKRRIEAGELLEWAQYGGNYYGTLVSEVMPALEEGKSVMLEIEVQGARQVLDLFPEDAVGIFIDAGSWEELEERVRARAPITDAELEKRRKRYDDELTFKEQASFVIKNPNGKLEEAKQAFAKVVIQLCA